MAKPLNLESVLDAHAQLRDRIYDTVYGEHEVEDSLYAIVASKLFGYAFNTYKALGLLLPQHFYEQATALFRTLWEVALNLTWIARDPKVRSQAFLQFTTVEYRKFLQYRAKEARRKGADDENSIARDMLELYEQLFDRQLSAYSYRDKKGKSKTKPHFSGPSLEEVVRDLDGRWEDEYGRVYQLGSYYVHGAPGGVLFPLESRDQTEEDLTRSAVVGLWSMEIMARVYRLWLQVLKTDDEEFLQAINDRIQYNRSL